MTWLAGKLAHKLAPLFVVVLMLGLFAALSGWLVTAFELNTARKEQLAVVADLGKLQAAHQKLFTDAQAFAGEVAERERERDQAHQKRLMEIENAKQKSQLAADARARRLAADYRDGLIRVRSEVCAGSPGDPSGDGEAGTAAGAGLGLRGAAVRENPAVLAVRVGAAADAELRQCRAYVVAQAERCPQGKVAPQ